MNERDFHMDDDRFFIRQQPIRGPLKVYQGGRFMGTVPGFPVRSTSGIFDVRPSDFTPTGRDGETVLAAHSSIYPGDWACIAGFVPAADLPGSYSQRSEAEEIFDALHSLTKAERMEATLEGLLSRDSKRSGEASETAKTGSTEGKSAGPKGIAQNPTGSTS